MSWSSRAIRARSSATATRAAKSRSRSAACARCSAASACSELSRTANPASQLIANWSGMKIICAVECPGIMETTIADPTIGTLSPTPAWSGFRRLPSRNALAIPARKRLIGNVVTPQSTYVTATASTQ